ncbi:hypothetical protein M3182_14760 [Mesobacillus maritimus]|uniref:hypothetical protein n=1 Tax=Mesobacillus maritimus TaxID=1643336 RepID=UPI00203F6C17|nr:hypothetical protein [Mesobacillus maritimus]MCM3586997.1 hypothetical protein [Mesobacillus maritimus]
MVIKILVDIIKEYSKQINFPILFILSGFIWGIYLIWIGREIPANLLLGLTVFSIFLAIYEYFKLHKLKNETHGKFEKANKFETPQRVLLTIGILVSLSLIVFYDFFLVALEQALNDYDLSKEEIVKRIGDTGTLLGPALVIYTVGKNSEIRKIKEKASNNEVKVQSKPRPSKRKKKKR